MMDSRLFKNRQMSADLNKKILALSKKRLRLSCESHLSSRNPGFLGAIYIS